METAKDYQKAVSFLSRTSPHSCNALANIEQVKNEKNTGGNQPSCHKKVQEYLKKAIPEIHLEKRFPQIGRIADAVWECKKIVFEIQVSPITRKEVSSRIRDYHRAGFSLVWILHQKTFGRYKIQEAEKAFFRCPCYYTDIDLFGKGSIFDLWRFTFKNRQYFLSRPFPIFPFEPLEKEKNMNKAPSFLFERKKHPLYFSGDLMHLFLNETREDFFSRGREKEKKLLSRLRKQVFRSMLTRFYRFFYRIALILLDSKKSKPL